MLYIVVFALGTIFGIFVIVPNIVEPSGDDSSSKIEETWNFESFRVAEDKDELIIYDQTGEELLIIEKQ